MERSDRRGMGAPSTSCSPVQQQVRQPTYACRPGADPEQLIYAGATAAARGCRAVCYRRQHQQSELHAEVRSSQPGQHGKSTRLRPEAGLDLKLEAYSHIIAFQPSVAEEYSPLEGHSG